MADCIEGSLGSEAFEGSCNLSLHLGLFRAASTWVGRLTGKHGDVVDIMEVSMALAFEAGPQICDEDLSSFVEAYPTAFEIMPVIEAWKIVDHEVYQSSRRTISLSYTSKKATVKPLWKMSECLQDVVAGDLLFGVPYQLLACNQCASPIEAYLQ